VSEDSLSKNHVYVTSCETVHRILYETSRWSDMIALDSWCRIRLIQLHTHGKIQTVVLLILNWININEQQQNSFIFRFPTRAIKKYPRKSFRMNPFYQSWEIFPVQRFAINATPGIRDGQVWQTWGLVPFELSAFDRNPLPKCRPALRGVQPHPSIHNPSKGDPKGSLPKGQPFCPALPRWPFRALPGWDPSLLCVVIMYLTIS